IPPASPVLAWVVGLGVLVLGLALRGFVDDVTGPWWPAGAVLSVSAMAAGLAAWRRQEAWAFIAGLGVHLAASLVFVHAYRPEPLAAWWPWLVQLNGAVTAAVALVWLFLARRTPEGAFTPTPTLPHQGGGGRSVALPHQGGGGRRASAPLLNLQVSL